jgi:hypothetical protein
MRHLKKFNEELTPFRMDDEEMAEYQRGRNSGTIQLNVTIPGSMTEIAKKHGVSESNIEEFFSEYISHKLGMTYGTEGEELEAYCQESDNVVDFSDSYSEGVAYKASVRKDKKLEVNDDRRDQMRKKIADHIKSQGCKTKQIGNDLEVHHDDKHLAQVMFRKDYIGVQKEGNKFPKEFEYNELGKIKTEITNIIKSNKNKK